MKKRMTKIVGMSALALVGVVGQASAVIDSTGMDAVKADVEAWISYGVAAAVGMLGLGLAWHGGKWAYRKIISGLKSN